MIRSLLLLSLLAQDSVLLPLGPPPPRDNEDKRKKGGGEKAKKVGERGEGEG